MLTFPEPPLFAIRRDRKTPPHVSMPGALIALYHPDSAAETALIGFRPADHGACRRRLYDRRSSGRSVSRVSPPARSFRRLSEGAFARASLHRFCKRKHCTKAQWDCQGDGEKVSRPQYSLIRKNHAFFRSSRPLWRFCPMIRLPPSGRRPLPL